jgi:hypothetical protein
MTDDRTRPDQATRAAERAEASAPHRPDRMPTPEEEDAADELTLNEDVAAHEREMAERGARQQGEGRLP